jgi:uncharacterized delta-60 repeat protein
MPRVVWPAALLASAVGCNAALGIHEKERVPADAGAPADGGTFALAVVKPPTPAGGMPVPLHLVRGSMATIDVTVARSGGFSGTIVVLVSGLARGVTADPLVIVPSQNAGSVTLRAADSAELGLASLSIIGVHEDQIQDPIDVPLLVQDAPGSPDKTFGDGGKVTIPVGIGGVGRGGVQLTTSGANVGSIVVCGHAKTDSTDSSLVVSRILPSGDLDPAFTMGAGFALGNSPGSKADSCAAVFIRPNGGIVYTGFATPGAGQPRVMLSGRYRPDGFPDQNFGPLGGFGTTPFDGTGSEGYHVVGPTPVDNFVVGGFGQKHPALLRFNKNGVLDVYFGTAAAQELAVEGGIRWVAQQPNGGFVTAVDASAFLVAHFSPDGLFDKTFGDNGTKSISKGGQAPTAAAVLAPSDETIFAIGTETGDGGATDILVARLTKAGQLDPGFGTAGIASLHFAGTSIVSSALASDGAIVIAGQTPADAGAAFSVLRVSGDGKLDATFGTAGRQTLGMGMAQALVVDGLGRIVVAGFTGGATEGSLVVYRLWP